MSSWGTALQGRRSNQRWEKDVLASSGTSCGHTHSSPFHVSLSDPGWQVHTLLSSAQLERAYLTWSPSVLSAAAEPPSALSRKRPTVPASPGGLGEGA